MAPGPDADLDIDAFRSAPFNERETFGRKAPAALIFRMQQMMRLLAADLAEGGCESFRADGADDIALALSRPEDEAEHHSPGAEGLREQVGTLGVVDHKHEILRLIRKSTTTTKGGGLRDRGL